jgi:Protein of unknown function (DUF3237)
LIDLLPLCTLDVVLAEPLVIGGGPSGLRLIYEVVGATASGERLTAQLSRGANADWVTVAGAVGSLDVRMTLTTHDGANILVQYRGRMDLTNGPGSSPIYIAPLFETGDARYGWLNQVQAVGKGSLEGNLIKYEFFEVR